MGAWSRCVLSLLSKRDTDAPRRASCPKTQSGSGSLGQGWLSISPAKRRGQREAPPTGATHPTTQSSLPPKEARAPPIPAARSHARLPNELFHHILSFLPPDTKLFPLLLVNSTFHVEVERHLYSHISLAGDEIGVRFDHFPRRLKLFNILVSVPRLSCLVYTFELHPFLETDRWAKFSAPTIWYWETLNLALRAMTNLKAFTIGDFSARFGSGKRGIPAKSLNALFHGCSFSLRKLELLQINPQDLSVLESGHIVREVEHVQMTFEADSLFKASQAFPLLATLEITSPGARLPELMSAPRSVKALSLKACKVLCKALSCEGLEYLGVRSLKIQIEAPVDLGAICMAFPGLHLLMVDCPAGLIEEVAHSATKHLDVLVQLRKVVFGKTAMTSQKNLHRRQHISNHLLCSMQELEVVSFGTEEWRRLPSGGVRCVSGPANVEEWRDRSWWK